jgi:putative transposase
MKRTHRIYNELGLQLRNKTPKRRVKAKLREDRCAASHVNYVWAIDFVHGLSPGRGGIEWASCRYPPIIPPKTGG